MAKWLFLPLPSGKQWNGLTIHTQSLGGSEASVAYTARALAKLGHQVVVAGHMDQPESVADNVRYVHNSRIGELAVESWDAVVSSRWIDAINNVQWKTPMVAFWSHDMPVQLEQLNCNVFVGLTKFHLDAWKVERIFTTSIIGDGVDIQPFDNIGDIPRDVNRLVWASNPDRGLSMAAKIFQEIRKRWPEMEFHVYGRSSVYGWGPDAERPYMPLPEHMENVFIHDSLPRYALFKELKRSWAYFYPTWWPETFCMATLEAQAAGTPVIASPWGALNETVKGGILSYDFLNAVSQLRNKRRYEKLSKAGVEWAKANSWEVRAHQWEVLRESQPWIQH